MRIGSSALFIFIVLYTAGCITKDNVHTFSDYQLCEILGPRGVTTSKEKDIVLNEINNREIYCRYSTTQKKVAPKAVTQKKVVAEFGQAVVLPIGVLGKIDDSQKTIFQNKFMEVVSNDYDLIPQEEYQRAEEEAFQELDYEECTEDQCIKMIQEILQVESMYKVQLIKDGNDMQVSVTYIDLDKKLVQTDFCEDCKTSALIKTISKLYKELENKR